MDDTARIKALELEVDKLRKIVYDLGSAIGAAGRVTRLQSGGIVLDPTGLHCTSIDGKPSVDIGVNGNASFGDDLSKASGANLKVFSVAAVHNDESFSAGDLLLGDNSTAKANLKWNKTTGRWELRSGLDATVEINEDGLEIIGDSTSSDPDPLNTLSFLDPVTRNKITRLGLGCPTGSQYAIWATKTGQNCHVEILAEVDNSAKTVEIVLQAKDSGASASDATVTITDTEVNINSPLNFETEEASTPTPAANECTVFARDNGAGKTQLCAVFGSGSVQVIATEP